ncbi:phosphodiester glycosidase family protein [Paenibacillus soyae]|uniref:Phosphodiester glycosidase family protein n=1 Tax=Paenibacillus soyae TaxID=2969249 RepID=A0A9X2SA30_9BACL|nr:phosphodiester glycosidase family protein [Paenibacillus soyae]MCR2803377.1 phosphodiester glycosidase family protein [Paenibacillus soyae]
MSRNKKKIWLTATASTLLVIGSILYLLADRYLIEHVEVVVTDEAPAAEASSGTETSADTSTASSSELSPDAAETELEEVPSTQAEQPAVSDDWSYKDENVSLSIEQVQTGSGSDTITYFVADVVLEDSSSLRTAFAKDSFGRNIIENTSTIASGKNAIFAINGDYYGFRDNGVIIRNGTLFRDEPARDALALFADGSLQTYNEEEMSSEELLQNGVTNTFSFGPILVSDGQVATNLDQVTIDTNFGNRSIEDANPRTGIGMIAPNHYVFVVVDGRSRGYSRGMTLNEFAALFQELGATEAYNLDGGGSSTMYFNGRVVNSPQGKGEERGVSDIIYIGA